MLGRVGVFAQLCRTLSSKSEVIPFANGALKNNSVGSSYLCDMCRSRSFLQVCAFHGSVMYFGGEDQKQLAASMPKKEDRAEGEKSIDIDTLIKSKDDVFPDAELPKRIFDGVPSDELPIVNIKSTKNNTLLDVTDFKGVVKLFRSCGVEGFNNTRKGTNIAAQATAITLSEKMLLLRLRTVRVRVQGLGPGRMSAIKGLQMGGINIISITDSTRVSWNPPRPS